MTDFNYKKYSLENLENWLHDAMSSADASPQEIYDTIKKVVEEQYYYYKDGASRTNELLALLNGNGKGHIRGYDDHIHFNIDPGGNVIDFTNMKNEVDTWVRSVEMDAASGEMFITLPDDLMEQVGWKEGDEIDWIDNGNGSYTLKLKTTSSVIENVGWENRY